MILYYDNLGKLNTIIPHGEIPRQGDSSLDLYVYFKKDYYDATYTNYNLYVRYKFAEEIAFSGETQFDNDDVTEGFFVKLDQTERIGDLQENVLYRIYKIEIPNIDKWGKMSLIFDLKKTSGATILDIKNLGKAEIYIEKTLGLASDVGLGMTRSEYETLIATLNSHATAIDNRVINGENPRDINVYSRTAGGNGHIKIRTINFNGTPTEVVELSNADSNIIVREDGKITSSADEIELIGMDRIDLNTDDFWGSIIYNVGIKFGGDGYELFEINNDGIKVKNSNENTLLQVNSNGAIFKKSVSGIEKNMAIFDLNSAVVYADNYYFIGNSANSYIHKPTSQELEIKDIVGIKLTSPTRITNKTNQFEIKDNNNENYFVVNQGTLLLRRGNGVPNLYSTDDGTLIMHNNMNQYINLKPNGDIELMPNIVNNNNGKVLYGDKEIATKEYADNMVFGNSVLLSGNSGTLTVEQASILTSNNYKNPIIIWQSNSEKFVLHRMEQSSNNLWQFNCNFVEEVLNTLSLKEYRIDISLDNNVYSWTLHAIQQVAYSKNKTDDLLTYKEDKSNKKTSWSTTPNDTNYPSEKLVKDTLDNKVNKSDVIAEASGITNDTDKVLSSKAVNTIKTELQNQIDGINAGQNLADIVADLTVLSSMPTTSLQVGDKIQVLADGNHSSASTVYSWNGTTLPSPGSEYVTNGTGYFVYIGEYGQDSYKKAETYNQTEVNSLLNGKQNEINALNMLDADYVNDDNSTHKFVTDSDKTNWDGKLDASNVGIVTISTSSGTLTSDQLTECNKNIAVVVYGNKRYYKTAVKNNQYYFQGNLYTYTDNNTNRETILNDLFVVDVTTGQYVTPSEILLEYESISSAEISALFS